MLQKDQLHTGTQLLVNGHPAVVTEVRPIAEGGGTRYVVRVFLPGTPTPPRLFGAPVVGQWTGKERLLGYDPKLERYHWCNPWGTAIVEENTDHARHIDYHAWLDAFEQVYSRS
jgi:hypothetical protein